MAVCAAPPPLDPAGPGEKFVGEAGRGPGGAEAGINRIYTPDIRMLLYFFSFFFII